MPVFNNSFSHFVAPSDVSEHKAIIGAEDWDDPACQTCVNASNVAKRFEINRRWLDLEWNSTTTPEEGAVVYVLASDKCGRCLIPFPVVFRDDSW